MTDEIELQSASVDIWDKKYRLRNVMGEAIDKSIEDTFKRVAKSLSSKEKVKDRKKYEKSFYQALRGGAIPGGRILSNAGAKDHKPTASLINCTVSDTIPDSMSGIMEKAKEAAETLRAGCGIGYCWTTLRPKGDLVRGAGAETSGPLTFMDIYDAVCKTVSSAGGRRGAQMGTMDIHHPDIIDFILAKKTNGRLRQFNLSVLITKEFLNAVKEDGDWELYFPISRELSSESDIVWKEWSPIEDRFLVNDGGLVACRVHKRMKAKRLFDIIMSSTYDYAEPGFIIIDETNHMNNNWFCEDLKATNPCGEQPLPPYGSCLLGSVDLTKFVRNHFTQEAKFDWAEFKKVCKVFARMLDNVVEMNGLPLKEQVHEIESKRRHGMGITGLGSAFAMMGLRYGSQESIEMTDRIGYELAIANLEAAVELSKEKGEAPILKQQFEITPSMIRKNEELAQKHRVGDKVLGRDLWLMSNYISKFRDLRPDLISDLKKYGARFTHGTSIAPTGTISLSIANNCSNGVEPSFAHMYSRNVIRKGRNTKEKIDVFSAELLHYRRLMNSNASPYAEEEENKLPDYMVTSDTIAAKEHIDIQAALQKWVDSSISKTVNVPTDYPFEDFKDIYMYAVEKGLKGCTTFRFNPEVFQGVLVKDEDLKSTTYVFIDENDEKFTVQGDAIIDYEGEQMTAANLYDALKEGYYGRL